MALFYDLNSVSPTSKPLLEDGEALHQILINILNTKRGERPFNDIGNDLEDHLFEIIDDVGALGLLSTINTLIDTYSDGLFTLDTRRTVIAPFPNEARYDTKIVVNLSGDKDQSYSFEGSISQ